MRQIIAILSIVCVSGCALPSAQPHTSVTPGESRIVSEREEKLPSSSTIRISTQTAAANPAPTPSVRVKITVPDSAPR